jgi:hypothetical protein
MTSIDEFFSRQATAMGISENEYLEGCEAKWQDEQAEASYQAMLADQSASFHQAYPDEPPF